MTRRLLLRVALFCFRRAGWDGMAVWKSQAAEDGRLILTIVRVRWRNRSWWSERETWGTTLTEVKT